MDPIEIPVPGLVVLIGAAGAGKSTLARRLFEPGEVLSSDGLREALSGDPADQRATRTAFAILHREVRARLANGRLAVVDATNVTAPARASLRRLAGRAGVPAIAILLSSPAVDVHARNAGRSGRVVPVEVVDRHLAAVRALGSSTAAIATALAAEGFARTHVLRSATDLDTVTAVRRPIRVVSPP
jgi:protein phosphatase